MSVGKVVGNQERYRIDGLIANGAFSVVYRCTDLSTDRTYAIKVMNKAVAERNHMTEALIREVNAMEVAGQSPYVVGLVDKLVSKSNFYIIMDLAEGGTLLDFIRQHRHSTSKEWIRRYFAQLLLGLSTLHDHNVVHRDIKPENLLFDAHRTRLLISDFGFACYAPEGHFLHRACGTLKYCAPELLSDTPCYDGRKVDVWAAGVTLYVMTFGAHPYLVRSNDPDAMLELISHTKYTLPRPVSPEFQHLLSVMLEVDPAKRWSVRELLEHSWVKETAAAIKSGDDQAILLASPALASPLHRNGDGYGMLSPPPEAINDVDDGFYHSSFNGGESSFSEDEERDSSSSFPSSEDGEREGEGRGVDANDDAFQASCGSRYGSHSLSPVGSRNTGSGSFSSDGSAVLSGRGSGSRSRRPGKDRNRHGLVLTIQVIFDFVLFCAALLFASVLRLLFAMDVADLPLPQWLRELVERLLIPPYERDERQPRRPGRGVDAELSRYSSSAEMRDRTASLRATPVPGSQVRRYVRRAEKLLHDTELVQSFVRHASLTTVPPPPSGHADAETASSPPLTSTKSGSSDLGSPPERRQTEETPELLWSGNGIDSTRKKATEAVSRNCVPHDTAASTTESSGKRERVQPPPALLRSVSEPRQPTEGRTPRATSSSSSLSGSACVFSPSVPLPPRSGPAKLEDFPVLQNSP